MNLIWVILSLPWKCCKAVGAGIAALISRLAKPEEPKAANSLEAGAPKAAIDDSWRNALQSVLRGRQLDESLPADLNAALGEAAMRLQKEGARLVQASLSELLDQLRIARESGSATLLENRQQRLRERISQVRADWLRELKTAGAGGYPSAAPGSVESAIAKRVAEDLAAGPFGLQERPSIPNGLFAWTAFSGIEVAVGALAKVADIEAQLQ